MVHKITGAQVSYLYCDRYVSLKSFKYNPPPLLVTKVFQNRGIDPAITSLWYVSLWEEIMKKIYAALLGVIVLAATTANAQRFPGPQVGRLRAITLNMGDQEFARMGMIPLKQTLLAQHRFENPENMELESIVLTAKSMQGNGQTELRINGQSSGVYTIGGRPFEYNNPSEHTFDTVTIYNSQRVSHGSWQLDLRGFNKVRRVTLNVRDRIGRPVPRPPVPRPPMPRPAFVVDVINQGYFPDQLTAQGVCIINRGSLAVGFTQHKQAGNVIEGKRSPDGSGFFRPHVWGGGYSLDKVTCQ